MRDSIETALALREPELILESPTGHYRSAQAIPDHERTPLRNYWRSVRKRLWLVLGLALLTTVITTVMMLRRPNVYEAVSRVQVDLEMTNPPLSSSKNGSVVVSNQINDPAYFNTQLQILSGPGLLRRVVKSLDLEHNQTFLNKVNHRSPWRRLEQWSGLSGNPAKTNAAANQIPVATGNEQLEEAERLAPYVDTLQRDLKVEPVKESRLQSKETRLIEISYSSTDPRLASAVVNTIADVFASSNLEKKTKTGNASGDFLNKRIAELQSQIRSGEEKLIEYGRSKQILSLDANQNTVVDRLTGLNKQLLEAENDRKLAEGAYQAAQQPGAAAALARENAKMLDDAEQKLMDLQQRRALLLVEATEEWPEVKELDQQISTMRGKIDEMKTHAAVVVLTNLKTRYDQALSQEQALRASFVQQKNETVSQNEAAITYRIIEQEIETNKNLLDGLLQRAKENDVTLAGTPNNINVVDYGIAPREAVGPQRLLGVVIAALLAIVFGICLAVFLEYLDNTVRSTEDVERILHLPALAVIPTVGGSGVRRRLLPRAGNNVPSKNAIDRPELLIHNDPHSTIAEAYKQLRTSILLSTAGRAPKTLLVTSGSPSEGKTSTAANTALSLAQTGARVLLIDGDMRSPRVHTVFQITNGAGLSTALSRDMSEEDILALVTQVEENGLSVITSGPIPPNPAELLGSKSMKQLLQKLDPHFDHIVIDSPPVTNVTDGVLLASLVEGVILVVHGGRSTREIASRARQLLLGVGARIVGVVLNNVKLLDESYYAGYYTRYGAPESRTAGTLISAVE